jgi:sugar lactone lactonase YvrE
MDQGMPFSRQRWHGCGWVIGLLTLVACDSASSAKQPSQGTSDGQSANEVKSPPHMNVAANDPAVRGPLDATPSPDGKSVYFTALALTADGEPTPSVFSVPADGGSIETLATGGAISAPVGISVSLDGQRLFLADVATGDVGNAGAVMTLATAGGDASAVSGTEGYGPRALAIAREAGKEWLYFTGRDPASGAAGVYRTAPDGGLIETLAQDDSFVDPGGVAVNDDGDAYVVDGRGSQGTASLVRVHAGKASSVVDGLGVGFPAGLTLTRDGKTALVSGLDPQTRRDVVYFVELSTGKLSLLSKPLHAFAEPAGLHRAHDADVFAWADSEANDSGTVYVLKPQS